MIALLCTLPDFGTLIVSEVLGDLIKKYASQQELGMREAKAKTKYAA